MDTENKEINSSAPLQEPVKEITKEAVIAELSSEERYVNYFKDFHAASVKHFINSYAFYKELWCKWGESNIQQNDMEDMRWINAAQRHLEIIQQQKLFKTQCLWRAEKITFAEVEICFDFMVWGKNVLHCPFIEPINDDDINLYIQYLGKDAFDFEARAVWEWQDHTRLKESYENEDADYDFPDWYIFAGGRQETGVLMMLPNIREEKEDRYRALIYEQNKEQHEELIKKQKKQEINGHSLIITIKSN